MDNRKQRNNVFTYYIVEIFRLSVGIDYYQMSIYYMTNGCVIN